MAKKSNAAGFVTLCTPEMQCCGACAICRNDLHGSNISLLPWSYPRLSALSLGPMVFSQLFPPIHACSPPVLPLHQPFAVMSGTRIPSGYETTFKSTRSQISKF